MPDIRFITRFTISHSRDTELAHRHGLELRERVRRDLADSIAESLVESLGVTTTDNYGERLTVTLDVLTPKTLNNHSYPVELKIPWRKK